MEEQHKTIGMFVEGGMGLVHSQLLGGKSNKGMSKTRIRKGTHIDTALGLRGTVLGVFGYEINCGNKVSRGKQKSEFRDQRLVS